MVVKELNEVYKCSVCGNVVETLHVGGGELVCCGKPMVLQKENTTDAAQEKHVPVIEIDGKNVKVKVGEVEHPMTKEHYIEWIEILGGGKVIARVQLNPGDKPEAEFCLQSTEGLTARAFCNIHGLWKA